MTVSHYSKAIVAATAAGAAALSTALEDGTVTAAEGWTALIAALVAFGCTWAVPNRPAGGREVEG